MENTKSLFFIHKINDEYIIYNSIQHIPIKVAEKQKSYFDLIFEDQNKEIEISDEEKEDFKQFIDELNAINFLSLKEELIYKNHVFQKFNESPKQVYIHLTNKCNLNCNYCFNKDKRTNFTELSLDAWKTILDKILPYTSSIILTGGEATLHPNFKEIVEYIKKIPNIVSIKLFSNASTDFAEKGLGETLKKIDNINFSCDNLDNDNHDRIGFKKGLFLKNINLLKQLGIDNRLNIASVWKNGQLEEIKNVKKFCDTNNFASTVSVYIPSNSSDINKMPLIDDYACFQGAFTTSDVFTPQENIRNKTVTCGAASSTFSIDPHGNVYPCQSFHFEEFYLGNIIEQSFEEIYNSNIATMLRVSNDVNYRTGCKDCNLKYICAGGCAANTFEIEKSLLSHPKTMCDFYKVGAIKRLIHVEF